MAINKKKSNSYYINMRRAGKKVKIQAEEEAEKQVKKPTKEQAEKQVKEQYKRETEEQPKIYVKNTKTVLSLNSSVSTKKILKKKPLFVKKKVIKLSAFQKKPLAVKHKILSSFFLDEYAFDLLEEFNLYTVLLIFRIKQNNFFITFVNSLTSKVLKIWSCGLAKLNASKRTLKFIINTLVLQLVIYFKNKFRKNNFIFLIRGMSFLKKNMIKRLAFFFKRCKPLFIIKSVKIFNGCRAKKLRRKKHSKYILLK